MVMKEIKLLDKARQKILMKNFDGDLDNTQASYALQGLLTVVDVIDASKAPVLKEQAAKLRTTIDANITKVTGVPFVSTPAVEEDEENTVDSEVAATQE